MCVCVWGGLKLLKWEWRDVGITQKRASRSHDSVDEGGGWPGPPPQHALPLQLLGASGGQTGQGHLAASWAPQEPSEAAAAWQRGRGREGGAGKGVLQPGLRPAFTKTFAGLSCCGAEHPSFPTSNPGLCQGEIWPLSEELPSQNRRSPSAEGAPTHPSRSSDPRLSVHPSFQGPGPLPLPSLPFPAALTSLTRSCPGWLVALLISVGPGRWGPGEKL